MVGVLLKALQLSFLKKCLHGRRFWKKKVPLPKKGEGGTGPEQKAVSQKHAGRMSFNLCLCQMSLGINLTQQLSLGSQYNLSRQIISLYIAFVGYIPLISGLMYTTICQLYPNYIWVYCICWLHVHCIPLYPDICPSIYQHDIIPYYSHALPIILVEGIIWYNIPIPLTYCQGTIEIIQYIFSSIPRHITNVAMAVGLSVLYPHFLCDCPMIFH